jgi:hypothetical protein
MIIKAPDSKIFFFTDASSSLVCGTKGPDALYQHFGTALGKHSFAQKMRAVGNYLMVAAEHAYELRQVEILEQIKRTMLSLPLPGAYKSVAGYYEAVAGQDLGRGDLGRAQAILERVVDEGPLAYRARGLMSLGAIARYRADEASALALYAEAGRVARRGPFFDSCGMLRSSRMIAVITAKEGDHRRAVEMLEGLFPLATALRSSHPRAYFDYLNSLAVELMEANRLEEAHCVSSMVLASPFAPAYPEWRETYDDIAIRRYRTPRSSIYLNLGVSRPDNLVRLRAWRPSHGSRTTEPAASDLAQARILDYASCRDKMRRKEASSADDARGTVEEMSERQLMVKIMELAATDGLEEEDLRRMVHALESIIRERGVS